jgi:hypothetical protein
MKTTAYSGRVTNWPLFWVVVATAAVLAALFGVEPKHPVGLLIGAVAVIGAALVFTNIGLTVGANGVVARYGLLGVPRFSFPTAEIEHAEAIDVPASQMGGWGLHYSPWRGTRMTVRSGPTLQLELTSGARVAISANDPVAAAAVVNAALHH